MLHSLVVWAAPILPYLAITAAVWATYFYSLKTGFVSDDIDGITGYDGKLQGLEYGMISRWVRYHLCGGNFPSKHIFTRFDGTKGDPIPQGKIPTWHHALSICTFNIACMLLYAFLAAQFNCKLALLTVILFVVHPIVTQSVAWCSGLGYPLSLTWAMAALNLVSFVMKHPTPENLIAGTLLFAFFQFMAIHAQFATMMLWTILLFFGWWQFAILGFIISFAMGFDIIRHTIKIRVDEFKRQNMGKSSALNFRKIVVAFKSVLYYMKHTLVPSKMGLYHTWGFHYSKDVERRDGHFVLSLIAVLGLIGIFFLTPAVPVKLAILWFLAFSVIFWNWITIQQFVTERYIFIPTIGTCLLLGYLLQDYLVVYAFVAGLYLCRTWLFLPTYDNELRFYLSNTWHFPDSEVAYGNLGVTYLRLGQLGAALDAWHQAIRINPEYDVPYYNIFSHHKANADMLIQNGDYLGGINTYRLAYPYLEKTLACKICHFPEAWKKEHDDLKSLLQNPSAMLHREKERLKKLSSDLVERLKSVKLDEDVRPIQVSIDNASTQLSNLERFMAANGIQ